MDTKSFYQQIVKSATLHNIIVKPITESKLNRMSAVAMNRLNDQVSDQIAETIRKYWAENTEEQEMLNTRLEQLKQEYISGLADMKTKIENLCHEVLSDQWQVIVQSNNIQANMTGNMNQYKDMSLHFNMYYSPQEVMSDGRFICNEKLDLNYPTYGNINLMTNDGNVYAIYLNGMTALITNNTVISNIQSMFRNISEISDNYYHKCYLIKNYLKDPYIHEKINF